MLRYLSTHFFRLFLYGVMCLLGALMAPPLAHAALPLFVLSAIGFLAAVVMVAAGRLDGALPWR